MKIKLNNIEFDVTPVPSALREVLLADEVIARGAWRDIWRWDHAAQGGEYMVQLTPQKGVPIGNGVSFFVARPGVEGPPRRADAPTEKMGRRFVEGVGAKSLVEVMQALTRVVGLPQRPAPLAQFAALNPVASYTLRQHVDFAVVQLSNAARNLSAYFFVPGQVIYRAHVTDVPDPAAHEAVIAAEPKLANLQPGFVLAPGTDANLALRRLAMLQRLADLKAGMGETQPGELPEDDPRRHLIARLGVEWRLLAAKAPGGGNVRPGAAAATA